MNASEVSRVSVIGAGLMGHGIALDFALTGYDVRMPPGRKTVWSAACEVSK